MSLLLCYSLKVLYDCITVGGCFKYNDNKKWYSMLGWKHRKYLSLVVEVGDDELKGNGWIHQNAVTTLTVGVYPSCVIEDAHGE